jgi:mono/diheme cytochrome c family protein
MKTLLKWLGILLFSILVLFALVVFIRKDRTFNAPYPNIHASTDSLIIERGKAIVYGAAHCAHCHTPIQQLAPVERGEIVPLSGGHIFNIPPGIIHTPNITNDTETGIGKLPDSVIARSLRYGVGYDGRALVAFMPFQHLSDEDLTAVISYLRFAPAVHNVVPKNQWNLLGNIIKALVLKPAGPTIAIPAHVIVGPTIEYGKYLAESVANCRGCHTDRDLKTGNYIGPYYGGGFHMPCETDPSKMVVTPNISSDKENGKLGALTEEQFIQRFRAGKRIQESTMPWGPFSRMSDDQLKAIYRYITSLPPVKNDPGPVLVSAQ